MNKHPDIGLTFALVKPHAMPWKNVLVGELLTRGFTIIQADTVLVTREQICEHYRDKEHEDYFEPMVSEFVDHHVLALLLGHPLK